MKLKYALIIIAVIVLIIIAGIFLPKKDNGKDNITPSAFKPGQLSISYEDGAMYEEWGKNTLEILSIVKSKIGDNL